jgi:hypothetical protein
MRHKKEPPYHLLKAEQISLKHALLKFGGEITGLVEFDNWLAIIAEISFHPQKKCYVGDIAEVLSTLNEATTTPHALALFQATETFSDKKYR